MEHRVKRQIYNKSLAQQNVTSSSLKVDYLLFRNTSDVVQVMITRKKSDAKSALKFCLYCKTTERTYSKQNLQCNEGRGTQCSVCYPYRPVSVCTSIKVNHNSAPAYPSRSQRLGDSITCDQRQEVSNEDGQLTGQEVSSLREFIFPTCKTCAVCKTSHMSYQFYLHPSCRHKEWRERLYI